MSNIIDFESAKNDRTPHTEGKARCLDCKHEWEAVVPTGTIWLECPACSLVRGRYIYQATRDELHFHCDCGNDLFHITPNGEYCPNCGVWLITE